MPLEAVLGPPQVMALPRGGRGAWGGPRFEWVDPLNLRAPSFVLDDAEEAREWQGIKRRLGGMARDMGSTLGALEAAREPFEVRPVRTQGSRMLFSTPQLLSSFSG